MPPHLMPPHLDEQRAALELGRQAAADETECSGAV